MNYRHTSIARSALAVALASVAFPALAQAQDSEQASAEEEQPGTDADTSGNVITVTGSRLVTDGNDSPVAVAVVSAEQLFTTTPSNISDGLRKLPQFAGSTSQSTTQGNAGAFSASSFLNLRSIGPVRNLVLFDGNRLAPSSTIGAVDINTIPQMLIERVDVVTGGVSAVYGSDAVSGVVNFVVDKDFEGVKAIAQAGISERGDNATQRLGIAAGTSFADGRGHIEGSFEYFNSDGIKSNKDRRNGALRYTATGTGTAANPFTLTSDSRLGAQFSSGGHVLATYDAAGNFVLSPFLDTNFSTNGVLTPFVHGTPTGSTGIESGGEGGYYESSLLATLETKQGFLRADYDLTDNITFHAQGIYTEADSVGTYIQPLIAQRVYSQNGFLSPALRQQMAAAGVDQFLILKFQNNLPLVEQDTNARNIFANVGFDGEFGSRFKWSLDYGHNESRRTDVTSNLNNARVIAALDAVIAPASYTGQDFLLNSAGQRVVCNVTLTNPGLYPGCLPLNVFGPTAEDPDAAAFTREDTNVVLTQKLDTFSATLSGGLFDLPAGEVQLALNAEYRKESLRAVSSAQPTDVADCTGLRLNCGPTTTAYRFAVIADAQGERNVKEIGGEILLPLLADTPFFHSLSVSGAARYTDYSTSGGETTWKAGINWAPTDDLRFRATRSRDIRAPTVFELFGPQQFARSGYNDLLTSVNDTTVLVTGGNPNLTPEKADTLTIGGVYEPNWLPGFSLAVDFFDIDIDNAIFVIDGRLATYQRQCIDSNFTSPVCSLYERPISDSDTSAANYPTRVFATSANVANVRTRGVDVDVIYRTDFLGGDWTFRALGTYQPKYTTSLSPTDPLLNAAGVDGLPKYRLAGFIGFSSGPISIDTQTTWHSSTKHSPNPALVYEWPDTPAKAFTDLTVTWDIETDNGVEPQFFISVTNLFDTTPGIFPAIIAAVPGFGPITTNGEDPVGRYFTTGFRVKF